MAVDESDLEPLIRAMDYIRRRPGMYIGSRNAEGDRNLLAEVLRGFVKGFQAGRCDTIAVEVHPDHCFRISRNGSGICREDLPGEKDPSVLRALEALSLRTPEVIATLTQFWGLAHFLSQKQMNESFFVLAAVALSRQASIEFEMDGQLLRQEVSYSNPRGPLVPVGPAGKVGFRFTFRLDPDFFEDLSDAGFVPLRELLEEQSFLYPGLMFRYFDGRLCNAEESIFLAPQGLWDMAQSWSETCEPIHPTIFHVRQSSGTGEVAVAIQWTTESHTISFVNGQKTTPGGSHVQGLARTLTRKLNQYARQQQWLQPKASLSQKQWHQGLSFALSVQIAEAQFEGPTRNRLNCRQGAALVSEVVGPAFAKFLCDHPEEARAIFDFVSSEPSA